MERRARDLVQLLCDLSEASDDVFQDAWLGDECRQHIAVLATMGVIEPGPTPATVTCTMCDADHAATLNYDPASRRYVHFCPEAGFVAVNDADLATHRFRPEWLVDWIVRELPITSPPRRRAIVPECVWHLGDAKCGDTWVTAIFARRISNLIPRVTHIVGYSRFSLTRASAVVNCQSAFAWCLLRLSCHAATSSIKVCLLAMRRSRH